jgi:PleD family two-component response regulator
MALANQLGKEVFNQQIEHSDSSVAPVITVSLGVCSVSENVCGTAATLLREADAQLYAAKSSGRNQTCGTMMPALEAEPHDGGIITASDQIPPVPVT